MNEDENYQWELEMQELFIAEQKAKLIEDGNTAIEEMLAEARRVWWFEIDNDLDYQEEMR